MPRDREVAPPRHDAELEVFDEASPQRLFQVVQNVGRQGEQLALPGVVLDFHDEAVAYQFRRPGMRGDFFADSFGPGCTTELFGCDDVAGQSQIPDELAGAFHGWQDLDFIMADHE